MDDALVVRFVPKKVANMYTADNAMTPKFLAGFTARRRVQTAQSAQAKQQKPEWIANFNSKAHNTDRKRAVSAEEEHSRRQGGQRRLPLSPGLVQLKSQVESALLVGRSIQPQQVLSLMMVSVQRFSDSVLRGSKRIQTSTIRQQMASTWRMSSLPS